MKYRWAHIRFHGALTLSPVVFIGNISPWFYLGLATLLIAAVATIILRRREKKERERLKAFKATITSLRHTLKTLTENREEMVNRRVKALKKEIKALKSNLKSMEETLKAGQLSAKRNSMLMAKISNTLRTNLNDILGFSTLLGHEFALSEETELFEYNENIRRSGEALMHLLNNIIDISKIESNSFHLNEAPCDLTAITKELIEKFQPMAEIKGLHIVFKEEKTPLFSADGQAVRHILTNLLDNALRYTEKGYVKITLSFNGKQLVWTIKDTGMGIDKAYLPDIFEPFRQQTLGYSKTTYQGAGLGLPLIKNMLQIMGGHVEITSEKAVGTTVRVFFPYKKPVPEKKVSQPDKKRDSGTNKESKSALQHAGKRLVVFDEDKLENMLIKKILTGMEVITYDENRSPQEWTEMVLKNGPLPDIFMIELDFSGKGKGFDILKTIRETLPPNTKIPAVALSAYHGAGEEEKALQAGFDAFLRKPFRKNTLISVMNRLVHS